MRSPVRLLQLFLLFVCFVRVAAVLTFYEWMERNGWICQTSNSFDPVFLSDEEAIQFNCESLCGNPLQTQQACSRSPSEPNSQPTCTNIPELCLADFIQEFNDEKTFQLLLSGAQFDSGLTPAPSGQQLANPEAEDVVEQAESPTQQLQTTSTSTLPPTTTTERTTSPTTTTSSTTTTSTTTRPTTTTERTTTTPSTTTSTSTTTTTTPSTTTQRLTTQSTTPRTTTTIRTTLRTTNEFRTTRPPTTRPSPFTTPVSLGVENTIFFTEPPTTRHTFIPFLPGRSATRGSEEDVVAFTRSIPFPSTSSFFPSTTRTTPTIPPTTSTVVQSTRPSEFSFGDDSNARKLFINALHGQLVPEVGHLCFDGHMSCVWWTSLGECRRNSKYMHRVCKVSCGVCIPRNTS